MVQSRDQPLLRRQEPAYSSTADPAWLLRPLPARADAERRTGAPRAEWTLAFLTHCPQHRDVLWSCCSDCRDVASLGWGLGRGQPPTRGCGRCALRPEIAFWEAPQPLSTREERVLALETALLAAVASEGGAQRVADPRWVGVVKPEDFIRLVGELMAMLSWPDACGGTHLLAHLQQGSCGAHAYVSRPSPLGSEAFGTLRRQERFELLAGVVKLLGTGSGEEDQPRGDPNPFCCVYGPMSASGRREFLERLQRLASAAEHASKSNNQTPPRARIRYRRVHRTPRGSKAFWRVACWLLRGKELKFAARVGTGFS